MATRLVRNSKAFALNTVRYQAQIAISQDKNLDALL